MADVEHPKAAVSGNFVILPAMIPHDVVPSLFQIIAKMDRTLHAVILQDTGYMAGRPGSAMHMIRGNCQRLLIKLMIGRGQLHVKHLPV